MTWRGRAVAVALSLLPLRAFASATAPADLAWLVAASDAIVVGRLVTLGPSPGAVSVAITRSLEGPLTPGSVVAVHCPPPTLTFLGTVPIGPGLWFLAGDGRRWTPLSANTNPWSLAEMVLPLPPGELPPEYEYAPEDRALDKVVSELWFAIAVAPSVEVEAAAYNALLTIAEPEAWSAHRHTTAADDRQDARGCAVERFLADWERALSARVARHVDDGTRAPRDLAIALSLVADPRAVPDLARIFGAPGVGAPAVRSAARALRNAHSEEALPYLRRMLDDPDADIRYVGLMGLAARANHCPPGRSFLSGCTHETLARVPSQSTFAADPERYLDFWRNWYQRRATR